MITTRFKHAATLLMLLTLTMAYGTSVQAAMETLEDAYELNTKQILRWPLRTGDSLVVKPCDSCNVTTLQVTEETRYSTGFDAPFISLHDLLNEKTRSLDSEHDLVIVFFQPDNHRVTRIILQLESE